MIVSVPAPPPMLASPPPCPACNSTAVARISASRRRMPMRIPYMRRARYLSDGGAHKLDPHLGIERRAADQHAVELLFGEQFHGVLHVDTAAVQHPCFLRLALFEPRADRTVNFGGVPRRRIPARPDGADRFSCRSRSQRPPRIPPEGKTTPGGSAEVDTR